mmetsp:Transcript_68412/g.125661  ORF Transcript_68412/g.125661 Transcript_68412/m.125661 type:complete len:322 (-) Transcript_68412:30-995(-)
MLQLKFLWLGHVAALPSMPSAGSWCSDTSGSDVLSALQTQIADTRQVKTGDSNTPSSTQSASLPPLPPEKIPLRLLQTGKVEPNIFREQMRIQEWILANPGLEYVFMDDEAARKYLLQSWGERHAAAFDKLKVGAIKADFFRICYLAGEGGFYADLDNEPGEVSLEELRETGAQVVVPEQCAFTDAAVPPCTDGYDPFVWNAFLGSVPRNPVLSDLVESALYNIENCLRPRLTTVPDPRLQAIWDTLSIAGPSLLRPLLHAPGGLNLPVLKNELKSNTAMMRTPNGTLRKVSTAAWTSAHFDDKDHWFHYTKNEQFFKQCH